MWSSANSLLPGAFQLAFEGAGRWGGDDEGTLGNLPIPNQAEGGEGGSARPPSHVQARIGRKKKRRRRRAQGVGRLEGENERGSSSVLRANLTHSD